MKKKSDKSSSVLFNIMMVLIGICIIVLCSIIYVTDSESQISNKQNITESQSLDFTPSSNEKQIIIPTSNGLELVSGERNQSVDFYNPKSNNCYIRISVYLSDNTLIYRSGLLKPDHRIKDIQLNTILAKGTYKNCKIVYDCYSLTNKKALNNASMKIEIKSI